MRVVNLTPHHVRVAPAGEPAVEFPATGTVARVGELVSEVGRVETMNGRVPVQQVSYAQQIEGLPEPRPGVLYLVSRVTAAAASHRSDLVFPQGELRDEHGQIIGCLALGTFVEFDQMAAT